MREVDEAGLGRLRSARRKDMVGERGVGGGGRSGEECGRGVDGETRGPQKATKEVNGAGGCSEGGW